MLAAGVLAATAVAGQANVLLPDDQWGGCELKCVGQACPLPYYAQVELSQCSCECALPDNATAVQPGNATAVQPGNATATWDYYRIPKSGSTSFQSYLMACTSVQYHDHSDGCPNLDICNASTKTANDRSFVVLRRPSDRLKSQFDHMHVSDPYWSAQNLPTEQAFVELLSNTFAGCADAHCRVERINAIYPLSHRVIMYPSRFFTRETTDAVCFHPRLLSRRMSKFMERSLPSCPIPADLNVTNQHLLPTQDTEIGDEGAALTDQMLVDRNVYPEDVRLWRQQCSQPLAFAGHQHGARPTASAVWAKLNKLSSQLSS